VNSDKLFNAFMLALRCLDGLALIACLYDQPNETQAIRQFATGARRGLSATSYSSNPPGPWTCYNSQKVKT